VQAPIRRFRESGAEKRGWLPVAVDLRYGGDMEKDDEHISNDPEPKARRSRATEAERQAQARRERAAKTLRDNLLRRKQQGRARRAGDADETSGLPAAPTDKAINSVEQTDPAANLRESGE
jgi:hypothetical protein